MTIFAWQETAWRKKYKGMQPEELATNIKSLNAKIARIEEDGRINKDGANLTVTMRELEIAERVQARNERSAPVKSR